MLTTVLTGWVLKGPFSAKHQSRPSLSGHLCSATDFFMKYLSDGPEN